MIFFVGGMTSFAIVKRASSPFSAARKIVVATLAPDDGDLLSFDMIPPSTQPCRRSSLFPASIMMPKLATCFPGRMEQFAGERVGNLVASTIPPQIPLPPEPNPPPNNLQPSHPPKTPPLNPTPNPFLYPISQLLKSHPFRKKDISILGRIV